MHDNHRLYSALSKVAWGYFFAYFNFNVNTVSITPNFVGYVLIFLAIDMLKEEVSEVVLLKPLAVILILWHGACWFASWGGVNLENETGFFSIITALVNLYFHFQFLTNLAAIAIRYQPEGVSLDDKLLQYRTVLTVLNTAAMIMGYLSYWIGDVLNVLVLIMLIVIVVITICLMSTLFKLRRLFE